jgi:exosortase D (VPLPA-CTERM-specific)
MLRSGTQLVWLAAVCAFAGLCWLAQSSLALLYSDWMSRPEYSHGILIPLLTGYLLYARRAVLTLGAAGTVWGVGLFTLGVLIVCLGKLSAVHALSQYGFVFGCVGLFYAIFGIASWRQTAIPLSLLLFMVPLPHMLHQLLSGQLQLLSSVLGVELIRAFGIPVHLEGNVIDLGVYQLQVLEACDGLRYLFPLMTLSFIFAYLFKGPIWQRCVLFVSSIPLTIAMNSLRIAVIGFTVEHWGISMAEGFLHEFQGWSIFMVCVVCLLVEARLLSWFSGNRRPLVELMALGFSAPARAPGIPRAAIVSASVSALVVVGAAALLAMTPPPRVPSELSRQDFMAFPLTLDNEWHGRREVLERQYLDELKLDDYLLADYLSGNGGFANLYVAYYQSQLAGRSVHSPRTCLPGGGWEIESLERIEIDDGTGRLVPVNRAIIAKGGAKQLVYYWFEQRGRVLADEYEVKWDLLVDSLRTGRTDGAMVRLMSPIGVTGDEAATERSLRQLFAAVRTEIPPFLPG